jgi:hypothetical protein
MKITVGRLSVFLNVVLLVAVSTVLTHCRGSSRKASSGHERAVDRVHAQLRGEGANKTWSGRAGHEKAVDRARAQLQGEGANSTLEVYSPSLAGIPSAGKAASPCPHSSSILCPTATAAKAASATAAKVARVMEHIHSQAMAVKLAPAKEEKAALATVASPANISSAQHSPTQLNSLWWQQQFRPVDLATLPTDDPLLQDGIRRSELFPGQGRPPLDDMLPHYIHRHEDVVLQRVPGSNNKVVIVSPNAQMANRFRITTFALILGILFDKAVHVHFSEGFYADMHDLLVPAVDILAISLVHTHTHTQTDRHTHTHTHTHSHTHRTGRTVRRWICQRRSVTTGMRLARRTPASVSRETRI